MKTSFKLMFVIAAGLLFSQISKAQTAELQVIHNCADPAADSVDIYVNGALTLDNFAFRTATSFLTLPSGVDINVGVAPKNSSSAADTLKNFIFNLANGQRYVAVASGVLNTAGFSANPNGVNTGFTILVKDNIRSASGSGSDVDFVVLHGATDAPAVDVIPQSSAVPLVSNAAYTDITGYLTVPASTYILNITPAGSNSTVVASYNVDLSSLGGGAAVVFASGFLDPMMNQNGPAFGLYAALPNGTVVAFPAATTARLQVIHNAADPAAAVVDVYLNGTLLLPDFAFRTATPFIDAPAGTLLNIGIAPGNSTSVSDTLKNFEVTLQAGQSYVAVANGNVGTGFAANPDGRSTAFTLFVKNTVREAGISGSNVDFFALHGATDAPTVDVIPQSSVTPLVNDAAYGDITSYLSVPAASYILNVTPGNDNSTVVASYLADLSTLGGGAAVVFASGYLDPLANNNGPAFGLYAALPNGTVVAFPAATTARLQVIHNAADPAAAVVDVYLNGTLLLPDFAFRSATSFIDAPAGTLLNIGIAPGNSTSVSDTLKNFEVTLQAGQSYVAVANGNVGTGFAANPDGRSTAFTLLVKNTVREAGTSGSNVDFFALHGATDAPTVDVIPQSSVTPLVNDAAYGDITSYLSVPAASYILNVTPGNDNSTVVASYLADLSTLGGGAAVVFASGYLDPSANNNGPAFGLYAALPNGTVVAFPAATTARLQVIHNAADPAAAVVDVYLNGTLLLPDFAFRTATPFIDAPAGTLLNIGVAPGNSTSVSDTLKNFEVTLQAGQSYVAVANGNVGTGFAANPDGRPTDFTLFVKAGVREAAADNSTVDFFALHGASDAPTVDVIARGVATLVDDAAYGDLTGYISVPPSIYTLDVTPGANNSVIVASYLADLSTLGGGAAVVFASGFLDPTANNNGEPFGLFAALPNGTVVPFTNTTGVNEEKDVIGGMYPNPASETINISLKEKSSNPLTITISDASGRIVSLTSMVAPDGETLKISLGELARGLYSCTVTTEIASSSRSFVVIR